MSDPRYSGRMKRVVDGLDRVEVSVPSGPLPLRREASPPARYPTEALGDLLEPAARAIEQRIQAPIEICAQSVVATAALAVQQLADIRLPTDAQRPVSLYLLTVAESGERKSSADNLANTPVEERERELRDGHVTARADYGRAKDLWEAERREALKEKGEKRQQRLAGLEPEPGPPAPPILTTAEPTIEGLWKLMRFRPSLGLFSGEGGQFVGGFSFSQEKRLHAAAALSTLWDGETVKSVRAKGDPEVLAERRLSVHLMLQPGVASRVLGDATLRDQGLLSRFLVAYPQSRMGSRFSRQLSRDSFEVLDRYESMLLGALRREPECRRVLRLDQEATEVWIAFADDVERKLPGAYTTIKGLANKLPEQAARLAAVIRLSSDPDGPVLSSDNLARGVELARWYAGEAVRLAEIGEVSEGIRLAELLLEWIRQGDQVDRSNGSALVAVPDAYQNGPPSIRDKRSAERAFDVLADHGYVEKIEGGAVVNGRRRKHVYQVIALEPETL